MLRLRYKLIIAGIAYVAVLMVVYVAVTADFITSSLFYPLVLLMIVLLIMAINMIRFLDTRGRARTR